MKAVFDRLSQRARDRDQRRGRCRRRRSRGNSSRRNGAVQISSSRVIRPAGTREKAFAGRKDSKERQVIRFPFDTGIVTKQDIRVC